MCKQIIIKSYYNKNMGHSEDLENQLNSEALKPGTDLADQAVFEAQERIRAELKTAQEQSKDEYFTKININALNHDVLILLNELTKQFGGEPFSDETINTAKEFYYENNQLLDGDKSYDPIRPEGDEKGFFIAQMMKYPDVFRQYIFKNDKQGDQSEEASSDQAFH